MQSSFSSMDHNAAQSTSLVALVTAASKRLGRSIAIRLAELGYDIALHYNTSRDEAEVTAREIQKLGRECKIFQRNFSHIDEVLTLIPEVRQAMASPKLLVNNASPFEKNSFIDARPEEFDRDFNIHVKAPFFLIRDFAKGCENSGHVINIIDTAVTRNKTDYFTYLLSKKSLYELTRMAAAQLAPKIRVNAIAPGVILPAAGVDRFHYEKFSTGNLLHRAASPSDVLLAMEYLIKAPQVTGDCLFVDGGDLVDC